MRKTMITAALNGPTLHRGTCPTVPYEPRELADEAERVWQAGAAVVHVYAREQGGGLSYRVERFREVIQAIRARCPVLISVSSGVVGVAVEDRMAAIAARPDIVHVPMGTMTWARYNERQRKFDYDHVFANSYEDILKILTRAREVGVKVVATCYDLGHVAAVSRLVEMGALDAPVWRQFILGIAGGAPATTQTLCHLLGTISDRNWQTGVSAEAGPWRLLAASLSMGGHIRVGLQDTLLLPGGEVTDGNGALVVAAAALCRSVGTSVATVDDARDLLGL